MNPHFIPLESVTTRPFDLDSIQIANPCRADWDAMTGDDRTRHCKACAKNVYNLSALTRDEAMRLIIEKEGHLCVQLHRRADGTLLTSDCTVGISAWKKPHRALGNLLIGAMAAVLSVFGVSMAHSTEAQPNRTLGAPMVMGDIAPPSIRGEVAPLLGRISPQAYAQRAPAQKAKGWKKTNGKHSANTRKSKAAAKNRRHRR